jgi:hypothetical protein
MNISKLFLDMIGEAHKRWDAFAARNRQAPVDTLRLCAGIEGQSLYKSWLGLWMSSP